MFTSLIKILRFGYPYKTFAFLNIFFNLLYAFFSALSFVSLIPMLKVLFNTNKNNFVEAEYKGIMNIHIYLKESLKNYLSKRLEDDVESTLVFSISLVIMLFLLKNICNYLALFFITFLKNGILKDLRNATYNKIIHFPISYFNKKSKGDLITRVTSDVNEIQNSYLSILELIFREPFTILFSLLVMFFFSIKLTLFVLVFVPLSGLIISSIGKRLKIDSSKIQQKQGDFISILDETINGQRIIKSSNAIPLFKEKFYKASKSFYLFSNRLYQRSSLAGPVSEFLGVVAIGILLWFGGNMVLVEGNLSNTTFLVYIGLAYNILTPAKGMSKSSYSIQKGIAAADRIQEILDLNYVLKDDKNAIPKNKLEKNIVFDKVWFNYENRTVINDLSFEIKKGEVVALIGPSGSGKTTLTHLLNRFYDVDKGNLKIDGIPYKKILLKSLYEMIGTVTQDPILFNDSIYNNILLGKKSAKETEIFNASKVANAHEFIKKLPKGYQTNIGELGNKLSGGEKQRITIARALLKDPDLLILDEATSALDSEAEMKVQQALDKLMKNRTSLIIAHKISTIKKADTILILDKGKIINSGKHEELLVKSSYYKSWVKKQQIN